MKLSILQSDLKSPYQAFMRQAGYEYLENRSTGQGSFARSFGNGNYPRFHIYVIEDGRSLIFNAHLDQKQASYEGSSAHSGEYDSPLVKQELERLQILIGNGIIDSARVNFKNIKPNEINTDEEKANRFANLVKGN